MPTNNIVLEPVQEAYFGKTKNLIEAQKIVSKIITKLKMKDNSEYPKRITEVAVVINRSKENKELCKLIQNEFGFKEVIIRWDGQWIVNAHTCSKGILQVFDRKMPHKPLKTASGGYYDSQHNYICCIEIFAGLVDEDINAGEMMAIILHEIGHLFAATPSHNMFLVMDYIWLPVIAYNAIKNLPGMLQDRFMPMIKFYYWAYTGISYFTSLMNMLTSQDNFKEYIDVIDSYIEQNKFQIEKTAAADMREYEKNLKEIENDKNKFLSESLKDSFYSILKLIIKGAITPVAAIQSLYNANKNYNSEVFSDSFATAYGYGPEIINVRTKTERMLMDTAYFDKDNKYNIYNQVVYMLALVNATLMDPHPLEQTTIKNQINKLKRELKSSDVPPEVKPLIERDLAEAEKLYDEYLKMTPEQRNISLILAYRNINETYFGGKLEIRDIVNRLINFGNAEA